MPDWDQFEAVEESPPDWSEFEPVIKPTPYQAADIASMTAGRGKAPTGMESGTELTTAIAEDPERFLQTPLVEIPKIRAKTALGKILAAPVNVAAGLVQGAETPLGALTLPLGGPVAKGVFAGLAAKSAGEQLGEASVTKDPGQIAEGLLGAAVAPAIALHGTLGGKERALADALNRSEFTPAPEVTPEALRIEGQRIPAPEMFRAEDYEVVAEPAPAPPVPEAKAEPTPPTTSVEAPPAAPTPSEPTPPAKVPTSEGITYDAAVHDQAMANVESTLKGKRRPSRSELFRLYDEEYNRLINQPTPAPVAKLSQEVQKVARTEGQRSAKEVPIPKGPGARTYTAKPERPESYEATSLKNAVAELEAAGVGHNLPEPELRKMVPLWEKAGEILSKDAEPGKRLADDLIANPERGMTDEQSALLLRHKVNLMNDLNSAAEKTHTGDTLARVAAEKDYIAKSNELKSLLDAINKRGTQWGREGRWRQAMAYEDYSFATQEGLLRAAKGGAALTEAERTKLLSDIEEWKKNAAEQKAHREKAESRVAELQKQIPPLDKRILAAAEKIVVGLERSARSHSAALKEMLSRIGTSPDPTIILHASHVAAAKIARAGLDLAKLTDEMVREYGPKIAPMMGEIWKKANEMLDGIKAPSPVRDTVKSGLARKIKSLEERLASGDYEKPKRPAPRPLDPEGARLAAKGREIEQRFETARRRAIAALRSPLKKTWDRTVGALYNGLRGIKVLWHGTVGMMTHAGGMLYRASKANIWWRNFANQFKMWASPEYHEQLMYRMETDPEFENWLRAGAKIDPRQNYTDYEIYSKLLGEKGGRIMERLQRGGERGFAALKLTRFEADKADWEKVSSDIKNDPEKAYAARKVIAEINNRATGTDSIGGKVGSMNLSDLAHTFFFAPKLYLSRWMRVLIDPVRTAKTFGEWDRASDADKLAAKTRLKHATEFAGIYLGALAVNQGLLSASGSNQKVNFTDPTKSDWLKFKTQGKVVTADGGLLDPIRLIGQVVYGDLIKKRTGKEKYIKGKTRFEAVVHDLGNYARSKLNPSLGLMVDIGTQQDFQGRALPFSSEPSKYKAQKPYKWGEWILSQGPIPISIGTRQIYEGLQKHGLSKPDAAALMEGAAATAVGFTGAHESTDYSVK